MEFQKSDLIQVDNLVKIVKRGTYNLDGVEVLAMSECMKWLNKFQQMIIAEVQDREKTSSIISQKSENRTDN